MVTAERQITSKLVALDGESRILAYTQTDDPRQFVRELGGTSKLYYQVRIYEVCPSEIDDVAHFYDFEATCLLQRETRQASPAWSARAAAGALEPDHLGGPATCRSALENNSWNSYEA